MIDVLIVGAGPAGLAAALYAHRAGLTSVVLDRREVPIDKACGEGIMPGAVTALQRLGVAVSGYEFRGIRYRAGDRSAQALFACGPGLGVRRTALHAALIDTVRSAGIEVRRHTVTAIGQQHDHVAVDGVRARYLIGADGLHSAVRSLAGLAGPPAAHRHRRWGQRCHLYLAPWTDLVEVHWALRSDGEAYVTPLAPDCVGVAVLGPRRAPFADQLAAFPDLAERLAGAPRDAVLGAGPLRQRVLAPRAGRVLLVGDAAGYVDALTGQGIGVALRGAQAAISCLSEGRPGDYDAAWRVASRRYRLLTEPLLAAAGRPRLRRAIVPAAARLPGVFDRAVGMLAAE